MCRYISTDIFWYIWQYVSIYLSMQSKIFVAKFWYISRISFCSGLCMLCTVSIIVISLLIEWYLSVTNLWKNTYIWKSHSVVSKWINWYMFMSRKYTFRIQIELTKVWQWWWWWWCKDDDNAKFKIAQIRIWIIQGYWG